MDIREDTYCGLNCGACPIGMANASGDTEALERMANDWGRSAADLRCEGCKSDSISAFCRDCRIRGCARGRGLEFCFQCDAYPCEVLLSFQADEAPHHSAVLANLEGIRDVGLRVWLAGEEKRWSCPECGLRFGWYSKRCRQCGTELRNAVTEEKELKA